MNKLLTLVLFSLLQSVSGKTPADSTAGNWELGLTGDYGFLIAHRPAVRPMQEEHVRGFEITWQYATSGNKSWESDFLFPGKGITMAFFNLGSPHHLGRGVAVYPFFNFPLHSERDFRLFFRYGMGLGYVEKVFTPNENFKNSTIGSHLNGILHVDLHAEKALDEKTVLEAGAGITHFSNGSTAMPNLGINLALAHVSVFHYFGDKKPYRTSKAESFIRKGHFEMYLAGGFKKIYPPLGKNYSIATLSALRLQSISSKTSWGLGADLFYDQSLLVRLQRSEVPDVGTKDNFRPGIYGAYRVRAGNVGLMFNMGFYPYTRWKEDGMIYHRVCLRYYFGNFFACINLKTHWARADFIEWGLGWRMGKE